MGLGKKISIDIVFQAVLQTNKKLYSFQIDILYLLRLIYIESIIVMQYNTCRGHVYIHACVRGDSHTYSMCLVGSPYLK